MVSIVSPFFDECHDVFPISAIILVADANGRAGQNVVAYPLSLSQPPHIRAAVRSASLGGGLCASFPPRVKACCRLEFQLFLPTYIATSAY